MSNSSSSVFLLNALEGALYPRELPQPKVIYECVPRTFKDSNGDLYGDLKGLNSKIKELSMLPIDILKLGPLYLSGGADGGYDVVDYMSIDPIYGNKEDLIELVKTCKQYQIEVAIDFVPNHVSSKHEWAGKAKAGDKFYQDFFIIREGRGNGVPPSNLKSKFGGSAWLKIDWEGLDKDREWFILHLFAEDQYDLNHNNESVQKELIKACKSYTDIGIHTFRFDVANLISKMDILKDYNSNDRVAYTDGPNVGKFYQTLKKALSENEPCYFIAELSSPNDKALRTYLNPKNQIFDNVYAMQSLKTDYKDGKKWTMVPNDTKKQNALINDIIQLAYSENAVLSVVFGNHDQPRPASRFGDPQYHYRSVTSLNLISTFHLNSPCFFQGNIVGMNNPDLQQLGFDDVESHNAMRELQAEGLPYDEAFKIVANHSRDNSRTTIQWDDTENGGFGTLNPDAKFDYDVNEVVFTKPKTDPSYVDINIKKDLESEESCIKDTKKMLDYRKQSKVIEQGAELPLFPSRSDITAFERVYKNERVVVIVNRTSDRVTIPFNTNGYTVIYSNNNKYNTDIETLSLEPREGIAFYKKDPNRAISAFQIFRHNLLYK